MIVEKLMQALLSLDSYNRGYNKGVSLDIN